MFKMLTHSLVVLLIAVLPVSAATINFTGGGDGKSWNNASNWSGGIPTASDDVIIDKNNGVNQPGYDVNVPSGVSAVCYNTTIGTGWSLDSLTVQFGGSFNGGWLMTVTGLAKVNMKGAMNNHAMYITGDARVEVGGGKSTTAMRILSGWWYLKNTARLTVSGGRLLIDNPYDKVSEVVDWADPNAYVDIRGGTWQLRGNQVAAIQAKAALGWVKAYGGSGTLVYSYDPIGGPYGITKITAVDWSADRAHKPEPANGIKVHISADADIQLNWTAVSGITSHKVYFGQDPCNLPLVSTQSGTTYRVTGLSPYTTYYWRIDEVSSPSDIVGDVWSFITDKQLVQYVDYFYDFVWIGAGNRHSWTDPNNWYPKGQPDNTDWENMFAYNTDAVVEAGTSVGSYQLYLDNTAVPWYSPVLTIKGTYTGAWNLVIQGSSFLNVEEGGLCQPVHTYVTGWSQLHINGGTYYVRGSQSGTWWYVNQYSHLYIHKGTFKLNTANNPGYNLSTGKSGLTLLSSGQAGVPSPWGTPNSPIDIYEGQWLIQGNHVVEITDAIGRGWVKAYNGASYGQLNIWYDANDNFTKVTATDLRKASNPTPADGQIDTAQNVGFNWTPGRDVQSTNGHRIYLGTDYESVRLANVLSPEYKGDFSSPGDFVPGLLSGDTTYYWRVDEIDPVNGWVMGDVWQFKTAVSAISIEDFESYKTGNLITGTWLKGSTGASIAIETGELPAGGGTQSMKYTYNNASSPYYSEIVREFPTAQNFTLNNSAMLTVQFKGTSTNAAVKMYIGISDAANHIAVQNYANLSGVQDSNIVKSGNWNTWYVDLSQFAGVDLTSVKKIYLGFGNRSAPTVGGSGIVYFDNIVLSARQCINTGAMGGLDFNGDCTVNIEDFGVLAEKWLLKGANDGFETYAGQNDFNDVWLPYYPHSTGVTTVTLQTTAGNVHSGSKSALWYYNNNGSSASVYSDILCLFANPVDFSSFSKIRIWLKVHSPGVPVPYNMYCIAVTDANLSPNERAPLQSSYIRDTALNSPFNTPDSWWLWEIDLSDYSSLNAVYALDIGCVHNSYKGDGYIDIDDVLLVDKSGLDVSGDSLIGFAEIEALAGAWLKDGYWPLL